MLHRLEVLIHLNLPVTKKLVTSSKLQVFKIIQF